MKISTRLSLWYMFLSLAILLLFSLGTYLGMQQLLFRALDKEREFITEKIVKSYDPFSQTFNGLNASVSPDYNMEEFYLVVYNQAQKRVFQSPLADKIAMSFPLTRRRIEESFTLSTSLFGSTQQVHYRAVSKKIFYHNQMVGWVNIAFPLKNVEASMHHLLKILIGGILIAVLLVGAGSRHLTKKVLKPVSSITRRAQKISSTNLNQRLIVFNAEDELGRLSVVLNDLLSRLQKSFESQRQFMADAAHELRTPLAVLRANWEEQLNNESVSLEMKQKLVHDVETISRLSHIINNLLLLSQTESVDDNFEFRPLQLDQLLNDVVADGRVLAEMKGQSLQIREFPSVKVLGDKSRLYQLFFNLIDNAVKYTQENGAIDVQLSLEENAAVVKVKDNGSGIPANDLPKIFERFYRVNKDRSRKTGGSGLGLSICKLITDAHKGQIEVESTLGVKTVFTVKLSVLA